jgi:hypothetical protein
VRSADWREGVSDGSPKGRDDTGGSMRSTTARPASPETHKTLGLDDGYVVSRRASDPAFNKPSEAQSCLHESPLNRGAAKP